MKETVTLSSREIQRIQVLGQVCRGAQTLVGSIPLLLVSYRQAKRLLARYREEGPAGLAHRRRGQRAHNAYGPEMHDRVLWLHQQRYAKFNDTHFVEMLAEKDKSFLFGGAGQGHIFATILPSNHHEGG
jgi:transposase